MKWAEKEDEIVCKFYLKHQNDWWNNIDIVMDELKQAGFVNRDSNSTRMRLANFSYIHTGQGLSKPSKQSRNIYDKITK